MQKVFRKTLLVSLLLSASAFAAESNLLSLATNGAITAEKSATVALNDDEIKMSSEEFIDTKRLFILVCINKPSGRLLKVI